AECTDDFDPALISSINKALVEIWCSYPFDFRIKNMNILTQKYYNKYNLPNGSIIQKTTSDGEQYAVMYDGDYLEFIENPETLEAEYGEPEGFFIKNEYICFYPIPDKMYKINIEYASFAVGVDADNQAIYALRDDTDTIEIPAKYEQLFLNTVISKALMYAFASLSDENYEGFSVQYEKAYKLLIKAVGGRKKNRRITF
ncbi:MAG: hypothetical protein LUB59_07155, partial [Candidatus Gastranaerophilales bacterium]|nr:hypothetical protein [Candidatus Gastranaerophilales bacterium]